MIDLSDDSNKRVFLERRKGQDIEVTLRNGYGLNEFAIKNKGGLSNFSGRLEEIAQTYAILVVGEERVRVDYGFVRGFRALKS